MNGQEQRQKDVKDFTDLELGELQGNLYQDLMRVQTNLMAISQEIQRRKSLPKEIKKEEIKPDKE